MQTTRIGYETDVHLGPDSSGGASADAAELRELRAEVDLLTDVQAFHAALAPDSPLETVFASLVGLTLRSYPGSDAGISVIEGTTWRSTATSSEHVALLETTEYALGQGPCVDAGRLRTVIEVTDFASETRWVDFTAAARAAGVASALAVPISIRDEVFGALNLYSDEPGRFVDDRTAAELVAGQGALAARSSRLFEAATRLVAQLEDAMVSRGVIERAKGVLMAREGCDADTAFDILRRASQRTNRKLRDLAEEIAASPASRAETDV